MNSIKLKTKKLLNIIAISASVIALVFAFWGSFSNSKLHTASAYYNRINFQGLLRNSDGVYVTDGSYKIRFTIYDQASGGTSLWTETRSVPVSDGIFNENLGDDTPINLDFSSNIYYLGITVGSDPEMTPRSPRQAIKIVNTDT